MMKGISKLSDSRIFLLENTSCGFPLNASSPLLRTNTSSLSKASSTSMLDPKGKSDIRGLINEMKKANPNLTILSITHDVEEAFDSDEVLVLNKGELAFKGKPEEVFSNRKILESLNLDMPFIMDLKDKLKKEDINIDNCENIDDIAEVLWPSK